MTAIVHGWCGLVEKSNEVVFQQMVINKLWIPDDMINEIKDYLYINAAEVLRKFYKRYLNRSITALWVNHSPYTDIYGRDRQVVYSIGHVYGGGNIQIHGTVCLTCGDFDHRHNNMNGCCALQFDVEDEPIHLVDDYWGPVDQEITDETLADINAEAEEAEAEETDANEIPEITWDINIPSSAKVIDFASDEFRQSVLDNWNSSVDDEFRQSIRDNIVLSDNRDEWTVDEWQYYQDMETEAADYAEYMNEVRMEEYADRR